MKLDNCYHTKYSDYCLHLQSYTHVSADVSSSLFLPAWIELRVKFKVLFGLRARNETPAEDQITQQPKRCKYHNEVEDNGPTILNQKTNANMILNFIKTCKTLNKYIISHI